MAWIASSALTDAPSQIEAKKSVAKGWRPLSDNSYLGYCCWLALYSDFDRSINSQTLSSKHISQSSSRVYPVNIRFTTKINLLTKPHSKIGVTLTETWTTASVINTKLELVDVIAQGVKAEFLGAASTKQGLGLKGQKLSLYFTQGAFNARGFFDYNPTSGNVNATLDGVFGHEGFVVGGEAGYDVQKAALTRYSAALGYGTPTYSAALTSTNNLSVFAASYYHKVNPSVEAGVKAAYDVKSSSTVGLEIASKYRIDPTSFAKVRLRTLWIPFHIGPPCFVMIPLTETH